MARWTQLWIVLAAVLGGSASFAADDASGGPVLSIKGDQFLLDGKPFDMSGVRVASGTRDQALTDHLIAQMDEYKRHGVNTLAVFYQGSNGGFYEPFSADGRQVDDGHQQRMEEIIRAAGERGMVVVAGIFYQNAPFGLEDAAAVGEAVRTVTGKLKPYRNVIINIANEQNSGNWRDTAGTYDFRDPQRILELCKVVRETDPRRLVGGGGYDHDKNIVIGRSKDVDVLLFDTAGPAPNSGELYDRFVAEGVTRKPIVNVELFGGWTKDHEKGVFNTELREAYVREIEAAASRPGLSIFLHNSPWMQMDPVRYDLGGAGTKSDPGVRWYFEGVREHAADGRGDAIRPASERAAKKKAAKQTPPFKWVNPLNRDDLSGVKHGTFVSPSMKVDVGYCIYLPPAYEAAENARRRYPVVYYLHGGRPGSETKGVGQAKFVHEAIEAGRVPPMIYVFVNGGRVSHYNTPDLNSMGEDVFIKELIPHIDATYRTVADRGGRALDGFSQGGRGTARIIFRHPDLFCSASPGGGGLAAEKRISENNGAESETLKFAAGDDTWTLAREHAAKGQPHKPRVLVYVGTEDFNYESNLAYMKHLESLKIPFERMIGEGIPHSGGQWYEKHGEAIMRFHVESFRAAR